jgi:glycolate oxidase iron-sulfur subunit
LQVSLEAGAARCVKCQVCLPHCPTYRIKGEEGDSPRGRIALIESLLEGSLEIDAQTIEHLDGCLTCRACEAVCPAGVPYGLLIDGARGKFDARKSRGPRQRLLHIAIRHPRALARILRALRLPARLVVPRSARLRPYVEALAPARKLAQGVEQGEPVALFLGCIARAADTGALAASAELLAAAGYRVDIPPDQTCCGALSAHDGDPKQAQRLARRNVDAFAHHDKVIASATGCTAQLAEYDGLLARQGFNRKIGDVTDMLADALETGHLVIHNDQPISVAAHIPCTQRNILRSDGLTRALAQVPNVQVIGLPLGCCGAAGSYFLNRPDDADRLREPLVNAIHAAEPDYVVTANVGCRLHLGAGLAGDKALQVLHLASFLARFPHTGQSAKIKA